MDFDQLTTFVFVAKLKSFSRAGQKVFRSQSAVSAQIRQLEQAYKARLLDRSAKSVELTPAGEVLFEYAEKLLRLRDESIQVVADRGNVVQGPVVFGANEATCLYLLPDIFAEFQRRYPLVHISIYRNFSHKILQRVDDGSVDAGVSFISESFAKDYVKAGEVKLLTVEGVDLWRELGLIYRRDRSLPRAAQALIGIIREHRKLSEPMEAAAS